MTSINRFKVNFQLHRFNASPMRFLGVGLLLVTLLVSLKSCTTRVVYNQLDWLMPLYLEDYVSLNSDQDALLDAKVAQFLDWHRYQQLPEYVNFLAQLKSNVTTVDAQAGVAQQVTQIIGFGEALYERFGETFVPLTVQLSAAQKAELLQNLRDKNQTYAQDYVQAGEKVARQKGLEKITSIFEQWLGSLSPYQRASIQQFTDQAKWMSPAFLESRQVWLKAFGKKLNAQNSAQASELVSLFKNRRQFWSKSLQQDYQYNVTALGQLIVQILRSMDSRQHAHLMAELESYQQDFKTLAEQNN